MFVTAIIAAGGRGQRFGAVQPKQLLAVGGRAILERSVSLFVAHPEIDEVIVALPPDLAGHPPAYLRHAAKPLRIVAGGDRRQDSVANAFGVAAERVDVVVIHDAARPFASAALISRTIAAAAESGAAIAAVQARDTVKRAGPPEGGRHLRTGPSDGGRDALSGQSAVERYVLETLSRDGIFLAQTPQAFRREVLRAALALGGDATDEAALAERAGHQVRVVEGEASNIKITTASDLVVAEAIAHDLSAARSVGESPGEPFVRSVFPVSSVSSVVNDVRIGTGYDLHRLVEGRALVLGGVTVPADLGALGHSDADVVCHAVTDAVLGAAGLGDIGRHFPDSDPRWKGASSLDLLARVAALVGERGFGIENVDVTVILERPKLRPYVDAMRQGVATATGIDVDRVSVKAKTNEGVDAVGRGEAIAAHAVALLRIP